MIPKSDAVVLQRSLGVAADGIPGINTYQALFRKLGARADDALALAYAANVHFRNYEFNSALELCVFLGQAMVETDHFNTFVEYGNTAYFSKYDGRRDLGNTQPGDGARFRGRGIFQVTGRANYATYSKKLGLLILNRPEYAAIPEISLWLACQYWQDRGCRALALANDVTGVTRKINGGTNHLKERQAATNKVKALFGIKV